jgi:hypothetical protein
MLLETVDEKTVTNGEKKKTSSDDLWITISVSGFYTTAIHLSRGHK